jgi:hypothetical protein
MIVFVFDIVGHFIDFINVFVYLRLDIIFDLEKSIGCFCFDIYVQRSQFF